MSLNNEGMKSGLLVDYTERASQNACGATFQCWYAEVPMIRFGSSGIDDLQPMKIIYWDNSFLLTFEGVPVGYKLPTELFIDWLVSPSELEKSIIDRAV